MKEVTINFEALTPEQKKHLLEYHQPVIESLKIAASIIKNPIVKMIVEMVINFMDFLIDKIASENK